MKQILGSVLLTALIFLSTGINETLLSQGNDCDQIVQNSMSIQDAIDNASPGETICVEPGVYEEGLTVNVNSLALIAADENNRPLLDGASVGITIQQADSVLIEGFEIRNYIKAIELIESEGVQILNNFIAANEWGIHDSSEEGSDGVVFSGNTVFDNSIRGVDFGDTRFAVISNNTITDNAFASAGVGIGLKIGGHTTVVDNLIENNTGWGIMVEGPENMIEENTISGHQTGITLLQPQVNAADEAVVQGNSINNNDTGLSISSSDVEVFDNIFADNSIDVEMSRARFATITGNAFETGINIDVLNVKTEVFDHIINDNTLNGDPLIYIRDESNPSIPSDAGQIIVYNSSGIDISGFDFDGTAAAILIGYSDDVTISNITATNIGGKAIGVWGSEVVEINHNIVTDSAGKSNIAGIKLSHSPGGIIQNNTVTDNNWMGIRIESSSSAAIEENVSSNNGNNGVFVGGQSDNVTIENNTFNNNGGRGIRIFGSSENAQIIGNTIIGNEAQGIWDGLWSQEPGAIVSDNHVADNEGRGIDYRSSDVEVTNNIVTGNGDGAINTGSNALIQGNTVTDNNAYGIEASHGSTVVENSVSGNSFHGIRLRISNEVTVQDNTIEDNDGAGIVVSMSDDVIIEYNTVSGHETGMVIHDGSENATVNNNSFESGIILDSFSVDFDELVHSMSNNTVKEDLPLYHANGEDTPDIPSNAGQIIIVNSSNVNVSGFDLGNVAAGIQIAFSENVQVTENTVTNSKPVFTNRGAITIWGTEDVIIQNNTLTDNDAFGIEVLASPGASVLDNSVTENRSGVSIDNSQNSIIQNNTIDLIDHRGLEIEESDGTSILSNSITNNSNDGVIIIRSDRMFFNDNLITYNENHGLFFESSDSTTVQNCTISHNGESGMESHFGFRSSDEITIIDNTFSNNGEYGVNFNVTGIEMSGNILIENSNGARIGDPAIINGNHFLDNANTGLHLGSGEAEELEVSQNSFSGNDHGLAYFGSLPLVAIHNWWGDANGPSGGAEDPETGTIADGNGDSVSDNVRFDPWLDSEPVIDTAFFAVTIDSTNSPIQETEELNVYISVTNDGEENASREVELLNFDSDVVDSEVLTIDVDETETITLIWDTDEGEYGEGEITVRSRDDSDTANVMIGETTSLTDESSVVTEYRLSQNYPNPFNPATIIEFALPQPGDVELSVYNILGHRVATLVNEQKQAGHHQVTFDAGNLASGLYFYRIRAGEFTNTRKLMLIK